MMNTTDTTSAKQGITRRPVDETELDPEANKVTWTSIGSSDYDRAVYNNPHLGKFFEEARKAILPYLSEDGTLVEVGCGTCRFSVPLSDKVSKVVGVDISEEFLKHVRKNNMGLGDKLLLVKGDATKLGEVLRDAEGLKEDFWGGKKVVVCVMNTLGIMPLSIRQAVIDEMVKLSKLNGIFFLAVFNQEHFKKGVNLFYKQVPELCGAVKESDIDVERGEIHVESTNYYSHWFSRTELEGMLQAAGLENFELEERGIGWLATAGIAPTPKAETSGSEPDSGVCKDLVPMPDKNVANTTTAYSQKVESSAVKHEKKGVDDSCNPSEPSC